MDVLRALSLTCIWAIDRDERPSLPHDGGSIRRLGVGTGYHRIAIFAAGAVPPFGSGGSSRKGAG